LDWGEEGSERESKSNKTHPPFFLIISGALQAGVVAALLFALCTKLDAFFDGVDLPDGYTQRNIAVTLRTIGRGLSYLLTFIYAANAVGLGGLAVQLVFYPEPEEEEESDDEDEGVPAASPPPPPEKIE
jgi:Protein of unknown function (DUF3082)